MRVAVIGCGNVTLNAIVPSLLTVEGVDLAYVVDPTSDRAAAVAERADLSADQVLTDWRTVVDGSDVDALIVATPQQARPEISIAAARAGKHLLCEKPLAIAPIDAQQMVAAANENGVLLATVHNYVYFPIYQELKAIIESGEIGDLETATFNFLSVEDRPGNSSYRPKWRHDAAESGGGVLMDMLHAVYLADWFFGGYATSVSAFVDRRRDGEGDVEDFALVRYDYPNGHAMINMAWGEGPGGVELMGSRGRAVLVNYDFGTHPFVVPERIVVVGTQGRREIAPETSFVAGHRAVIENFREAIGGRVALAATGEDGARVLQEVVGAYESGGTGRVVPLPLAQTDPVYQRGAIGLAGLELSPESPVVRRGMFGVGVLSAAD